MSYQIQEFNINNQTAYLTGVDINNNKYMNTEQPPSCSSITVHSSELLKNTLTNKFYYHKELSFIKEINGAIIYTNGTLNINPNFMDLFSVRVYDISNISKFLYDGAIHGNMMNYVITSSLDYTTPLVKGSVSSSSHDYDTYVLSEITNVENGKYMFVTYQHNLFVNIYDANSINENLFLLRKSMESYALKPHQIMDKRYIYAHNKY